MIRIVDDPDCSQYLTEIATIYKLKLKMRKNSIKNTRINGEVQKELSTIIRNEIKDPRIHPMTSVMAVESGS